MAHDDSTHGAAGRITQILRPCAAEGLNGLSRPSQAVVYEVALTLVSAEGESRSSIESRSPPSNALPASTALSGDMLESTQAAAGMTVR